MKKAEHWKIDAFELWCWERLMRVLSTEKISYQSILKEISPECSLEGLMLKLKLQYFGHLMRRAESFATLLNLAFHTVPQHLLSTETLASRNFVLP